MPTVYTEVEVDVDLQDFETEDLVEELEARGIQGSHSRLQELHDAYILNRHSEVDALLKQLIYESLGRIV
jgi:hypothetical protein